MKTLVTVIALSGFIATTCLAGNDATAPKTKKSSTDCCQKSSDNSYYIFSWKKGEKPTLPPGIPEA